MSRFLKRVAAVAIATPVLLGASVQLAYADVSVGQTLKASNYNCGSNERITGGLVMYGLVPTKQHAQIYRNCSGKSVKRKADLIFDRDGKCLTIAAHSAKVLNVIQALPSRTVYRSSKAC